MINVTFNSPSANFDTEKDIFAENKNHLKSSKENIFIIEII